MSNLPLGAEYDSSAPFNEPLTTSHKVSAIFDGEFTVEVPNDIHEEDITDFINDKVKEIGNHFNKITGLTLSDYVIIE